MSEANLTYLGAEHTNTISDDLKGVLATFVRHRWVFLYGFLLVCAGGAAWMAFATPIYSATATIALDLRTEDVVDMRAVLSGLPPESAVVDTEVRVIQSRSLLKGVATNLHLEKDPALNRPSRKHLAATLADAGWALWATVERGLGQIGVPVSTSMNQPGGASQGRAPAVDYEKIVDNMLGNLTVMREGLTYAIDISYSDPDPQWAAKIANGIAEAYLGQQLQTKAEATRRAGQWLEAHVTQLRSQVEAADNAVEEYRSEHGLLIANGSTLSESEVTNVDNQLATARAQLADAQARYDAFSSQLRSGGSAESGNAQLSDVLQQLRVKYSDLLQQKTQLSATLGPMHPQMVQINQQIENISGQIRAEEGRIGGALAADVAAARQKVASLEKSEAAAKGELARQGQADVHLAELQRNADALRSLYESFLSRYKQIGEQGSLASSDARILSEATPPGSPSFPNKKLMAGLTLIAASAFASVLVFAFELFRGVILFPEELERKAQVPALGLVPLIKRRDLYAKGKPIHPSDLVVRKPMSVFTEAFRTLRVSILARGAQDRGQVIQMTSGTLGEGKTLCSIAFGRTLAMDGLDVLIIDGDLRRRVLTHNMRIKPACGLVELMRGDVDMSEAVIPGGKGAPSVLPLAGDGSLPLDLLSSERFEALLNAFRDQFDVVVVDSPPVLAVSDALVLAKLADIVVLIAKWGRTPRKAVIKALDQLQKVGANVAGILLTHVDLKTIANYTFGREYHAAVMDYYLE